MSNYVRFTLVLTCVCLAAAAGVAGIYLLTKQPIAEKAHEEEIRVRREVLPEAKAFREIVEGTGIYAGLETENGRTVGYVAVGEGRGYGGKLHVMVGLDTDLRLVKAAVLLHNETPGLGAELAKVQSEDTLLTVLFGTRSAGTSWMDQFQHKRKGQLVLGAGIDAKTGCTITSKAIVQAARAAIENVEEKLTAAFPEN